MPHSPALKLKLQKALEKKGADYQPRTRHLLPDGRPKYINRLILEGSPYLLQHAHNPVDWYSWSDEAFETARRLGRPVLLSVGYSTCHWCHVMEEESFEDEEIARFLNENYIAIKVDREERPDIDAIYMAAVQAIAGSGGWPMTVWLTPDRRPFYGGTYFPARDGDRGAPVGFLTVLKKIGAMYHDQPDKIQEAGQTLTQAIQQQLRPATGDRLPGFDLIEQVMEDYKAYHDPVYGGMSGKPKFPSSLPVRLLLRYYRRTGDQKILDIARLTLEKMAGGGIYDHVGGGFHRYATDKKWLVPHFEKMLYDNALLVMAYLEGYQVTGEKHFKQVTEEILQYIQRDMTAPGGAFYSATDADSLNPDGHREEGYYFTWTPDELKAALGVDRAKIVSAYYGVGKTPNFEGRHILHTPRTPAEVAKTLDISENTLRETIESAREILYQTRNHRPLPLRDDKILTAWNGLMISAFARAGLILANPQYTDRAVRAAEFILHHLFLNNKLYRNYKDGQARHIAYLNDYAFFTAALIDLYEATFDIQWLKKAIAFDTILQTHYEDAENGGFFMTAEGQTDLIAREKPNYDGAEPSGNSVALLNILRLGEYTTRDSYRLRAEKMLTTFLGSASTRPMALSEMLIALDFQTDKAREIVIVTPPGKRAQADPYLKAFRNTFLPNRILTVAAEGEDLSSHARLIPVAGKKTALMGKATAYVCAKGTCQLPATDPELFARQIRQVDKQVPKAAE
ncbi:MAG: thioredoxin domain-containing protein [Deltaproteobacteria bacterium]|nr:MAG: thioredoxin domain-containing protein [Deltaproteobacteria bacterium]